MPPAGVTDTLNEVYGEGDALDASHSWTFDENNNTGDLLSSEGCDSDADHFFIDFDNLFAWLEGDQPISPTIHKDVLQANQTEESTLYGKPFSQNVRGVDVSGATFSVPLEVEEHAHLQCTSSCELDVSNFKDGSDSNSPSEASKCPISFGTGMSHSLNWLSMSSSGHKNSLTDSVEPFEYQQLHTRCSETLSPEKYVYDFICDSQYSEPGYNSRKEPVQGNSNLSEIAVVSCNNKRSVASPNHPQSSLVADSSYFNVLDRCSFGRVHNDTRASAILDTGSDGNSFSIALDSSNDPSEKSPTSLITESRNVLDSCLQNIRDGELCSDWAPEMSRNVQPNLLATVNSSPEVYAETSAENTSMQFLPCHLSQSFILSDKQNMANGSDTRHMPTGHWTVNKVQPFLLHEGTFFNPGSSLPDLSCNGTNLVETINPISASRKKQKIDSKDGITTVSQKQNHVNQILSEGVSEHYTAGADEDLDVYIVNDSSNLNLSHCPLVAKKSFVVPPPCGFSVSCYPQLSSSRVQAADENLTFQIALQDLAQPKSEASPPEGVLAVPLLRHQRIALSWMIQKETLNPQCSGGILADDQGLGKTVSTIALILKERSPSPKSSSIPNKGEYEPLNLDEDDDFSKSSNLNHVNPNIQIIKQPIKSENVLTRQKGRPAAGTLVVCPTSVLRQWADELKNKVTSEANLSFLVYHGSNRTRDPLDIVKYDVVLTTYSIVSMEVPVQAFSERSDGKCRSETMDKERKISSKSLMNENIVGNSLLESTGRPLARVAWFRVILDEAQTIKNHRTQVARACWGLRAKRRWCLSGTPIQNAVDDLYSYFRFLKHEPFSVYNSFCSKIKAPISKDPAVGYKKLQAVLKTVMLRRTKGTLIDGKPIINLPPKMIELKKINFSAEERAFYSRLEAESREKFKGYADAGTVEQNYVNILLMLLRLRQACDHPLLVKGYDSSSVWRSSLEEARKIPGDQQIKLLNSLETCLALCSICSDPPEDAVVAVCGHVYCNQCISQQLTGDDSLCPSANCKAKLTWASVFSKSTLESCVSGFSHLECTEESQVTELVEANMSDSSKIKAAVEILQSLQTFDDPKSQSSYCGTDDTSTIKTACGANPDLCPNEKSVSSNSANHSNALVSEKAIVYSQWTRMLDLLEVRLKRLSIQYRRLDGTMQVAARDKAVKDFNTRPEVTVIIMSLKAASLGLNMVSACHVLLLDLWWNPTTEDQAIDRAHRIGQTRPVTVSRLTVENTVEDRILALQDKKREMVASAFGEDESGSRQTRLTVEDLRYLFRM